MAWHVLIWVVGFYRYLMIEMRVHWNANLEIFKQQKMTIHRDGWFLWSQGVPAKFHPASTRTLRSKCGASPSGYCTCAGTGVLEGVPSWAPSCPWGLFAEHSMSPLCCSVWFRCLPGLLVDFTYIPLGRPNHWVPTIRELLPWRSSESIPILPWKMIPTSGM